MKSHIESMIAELIEEMQRFIVIKDNTAFFVDPVFNIIRNRVNAEFCKTLIRIDRDKYLVEMFLNFIVVHQNQDGSWNEIHPHYNQPSALVTSFIGDALLLAFDFYPKELILERAKDFVLMQEKAPGYFLKSSFYTADHLNVDASCGAFLAAYGERFDDETCLKAAERAAKRICVNQKNGFYPYTSDDTGNYHYPLNLPCIHYQGVTMFYLSKIYEVLQKDWIKESLLQGAKWLSSIQKDSGKFDWSRSGLMFAYYLSGAYAFAFASYIYVSKWEGKYMKNAELCLNMLNRNRKTLILRWEEDSWATFFPSIITALKSSNIGDYPVTHKAFRFGYGMYRHVARRRYSDVVDDRLFNRLCSLLRIKASTIEPLNNFPDLFMTSEVIDCLAYSYEELR
jgi:hypothetical protein